VDPTHPFARVCANSRCPPWYLQGEASDPVAHHPVAPGCCRGCHRGVIAIVGLAFRRESSE
jgi:hypothetical protein